MILEGASHLNPDKSVVVVFGAQYYRNQFVEPLPELLQMCKRLVLVDIDPFTLKKLHEMLGKSEKVALVVQDVARAFQGLSAFQKKKEKASSREYLEAMFTFLEEVAADTQKRSAGLSGILAEGETADYVISSLVGTELGDNLKSILLSSYKKKFGSAFPVSELTPDREEKWRRCLEVLTIKHAEDLWSLSGQKGRVYCANTYALVVDKGQYKILREGAFASLSKLFEDRNHSRPILSRTWHWITSEKDYLVMALL
jgi:hypothetical protein